MKRTGSILLFLAIVFTSCEKYETHIVYFQNGEGVAIEKLIAPLNDSISKTFDPVFPTYKVSPPAHSFEQSTDSLTGQFATIAAFRPLRFDTMNSPEICTPDF